MVNILKTAYCFYITQLLLRCETDKELNRILDRVIDENRFEDFVKGDNDIKKVFEYVYHYRRYNRSMIEEKPLISTKTVLVVLIKSIF